MVAPIIYFGVVALASCFAAEEIGDPLSTDGTNHKPSDGGKTDRGYDGRDGKDAIDGTDGRIGIDGGIQDAYLDASQDAKFVLDAGDSGPEACIPRIFYFDGDDDGYGNDEATSFECTASEGYVENGGDCDNTTSTINPGAIEIVDGVDNDCDEFTDIDSWRMVSIGAGHSCGLTLDGKIRCWGLNDQGQAPEAVLSEETFIQVSAGGFHSCGLLEGGGIYCWGRESEGQSPLPVALAEETFNFVSCGWDNACGIRATDNTVTCWGNNEGGQSTLPPEIEGEAFSQVRSGWRHTCGIKTDGTVNCWGANAIGQTNYPEGILFSQISAGWGHNCGIVSLDNTIDCWEEEEGAVLSLELLEETFNQVGAGWHYSCGVLTTGTIECWGSNSDGQSTPPEGFFIQVDTGSGAHACGVTIEDTIQCWGNNDYEQSPGLLSL